MKAVAGSTQSRYGVSHGQKSQGRKLASTETYGALMASMALLVAVCDDRRSSHADRAVAAQQAKPIRLAMEAQRERAAMQAAAA